MKILHNILTNPFTPQHEQEYNRLLEFITMTRIDVKEFTWLSPKKINMQNMLNDYRVI